MKEQDKQQDNSPQAARDRRFKLTNEPKHAPDLNDLDTTGDLFRGPCKTKGRAVHSGAFNSLEEIPPMLGTKKKGKK